MTSQDKNRIFVKGNSVYLSRLLSLMADKGVNQSELGRITGIRQATISDYVKGNSIPSAERFQLISAALGVSMDYLWGVSDVPFVASNLPEAEGGWQQRAMEAEQKLARLKLMLRGLGEQVKTLGNNVGNLTDYISE